LDAIEILSVCKLSVFCPCSFTGWLSKALLLFRSGFPGVIADFPWLLGGLLVNNPVATILVRVL